MHELHNINPKSPQLPCGRLEAFRKQMEAISRPVKAIVFAMIWTGFASANPDGQVDGHFSSWKDVPGIIDAITEDNDGRQLEVLHQLTRVKLGYPQSSLCLSAEEHKHYMLQTKEKWKQWWESTGKAVSEQKEQHAKVDQQAFRIAWDFLGTKQEQPDPILPVWIPTAWTLYVTYTNSDYMGREKEVWIIDRQAASASLTKLRGDYRQGTTWNVALAALDGFTPERADEVLKALCYLHYYAPAATEDVPENVLRRLYYPHSTLHLRDDKNRILWNTQGYEFCKTRPKYGDGVSGRSYYFLRSAFPDGKIWNKVSKPTSELLAPYRMFLSLSRPYFCSNASDVVQLFGQHGGTLERQALLEWAGKQKAATNPKMDWKLCCSDFGTAAKVDVINITRIELQETLQEIKRIGDRLVTKQETGQGDEDGKPDADRLDERKLDRYVADMLATEKSEKVEELQRHPKPLRDLIKVAEMPDDSELKHLSAAIQAIRKNPDPRLFKQLVQEMDEGTLKIRSLLNDILLNEQDLLELKPWEAKQEAIAIGSCIDALPLAKNGAGDALVETLLCVYGGGKIEIADQNGGSSIEVAVTKNGHSLTHGNASHPLSLEDAQKELRRLYKKSGSSAESVGELRFW